MSARNLLLLSGALCASLFTAKAQTPIPIYPPSFTGIKCGDKTVTEGVVIDAAVTNDSGQKAFVIRWLDQDAHQFEQVHSAVIAFSKCIASDGDDIDGLRIQRILPDSLAISKRGVAYEVRYIESPKYDPQYAVIFDGHLAFRLDETLWNDEGYRFTSQDFILTSEGKIFADIHAIAPAEAKPQYPAPETKSPTR